jgi:hypothetical protein
MSLYHGKYTVQTLIPLKILNRLVDKWDRNPPEVCQNFIIGISRSIQAVIKAVGGYTKYQTVK